MRSKYTHYGSGKYRRTYQKNFFQVEKIPRRLSLSKIGPFSFRYSTKLASFFRTGAFSPNQRELRNFERYFAHVPAVYQKSFPVVFGRSKEGYITMRTAHARGKIAPTLSEHGRVKGPFFWKRFNEIMDWMFRRRIHLFDLWPTNILVGEEHGHPIPIFVDYKSVNSHYWVRFWLKIPMIARKNIRERLKKLEENYS